MDENQILSVVKTVSGLSLVKIEREKFLSKEFGVEYSSILTDILTKGPYDAGIPLKVIRKKAKAAINFETSKASILSFMSGLPGGFAMLGTIPADLAQFMGHALRIVQKIAYLSGMPSFSSIDEMTDEEANMAIIYLGIMFGSGSASAILNEVCKKIGANALTKLPQVALTKVVGYQALKKLLKYVGIKLAKDTSIKGISKTIPIIGGIASGGVTFVSLKIVSNRLYEELAKIKLNNSDC